MSDEVMFRMMDILGAVLPLFIGLAALIVALLLSLVAFKFVLMRRMMKHFDRVRNRFDRF